MPRSPHAAAALGLAAAGLALAAPLAAQAHEPYRYYQDGCTDRIHDNGVTGALLGGAAGALIGSNLASGGGRTGWCEPSPLGVPRRREGRKGGSRSTAGAVPQL